jgi:transcription initiation factor TFIIIB Brf1 subunit/transcription initiation factor TFIIB
MADKPLYRGYTEPGTVLECPDCGSTVFNHDTGEVICARCGRVMETKQADEEPIYKSTGSIWEYASKLGTDYTLDPRNRTDTHLLFFIDKLSECLKLAPSSKGTALKMAKGILKDMRTGKLRTKLSIADIAVVAIYKTIRVEGIPKSLKNVEAACKQMGYQYKANKIFSRASRIGIDIPQPDTRKYVRYIIGRLFSDDEVKKAIPAGVNNIKYFQNLMEIAQLVVETVRFPGRNPWLISAAAVSYADRQMLNPPILARDQLSRIANCGRTNFKVLMSLINARIDRKRVDMILAKNPIMQ